MADEFEGLTPINQAEPIEQERAPAQNPVQAKNEFAGLSILDPDQAKENDLQEKYGGIGNQVAAGALGLAQGVAGPLATAAARGLGATPEYLEGIKEANPITHGLAEATGFIGSALTPGLGEASLAGQVGNIGEHAAALLPEVAPRLLQTGVRTGTEMAALQASNEISDALTNKPGQTLGTAAINIGMSGILGGAGGLAIGSVSPLWNKAMNKLGVEKLASDFMGETKFLNEHPDLVAGTASEINDRIASADKLINGGLKKNLINKLTESITPDQVSSHIEEVYKLIDSIPDSLKKEPIFKEALENFKKQAGIPLEHPDLNELTPTVERSEIQDALPNLRRPKLGRSETGQFKSIHTPETIEGIGPEVTTISGEQPSLFGDNNLSSAPSMNPTEVFNATENFKRQLQEWGQYNKSLVPIGERPFRDASRSLATGLKESLEDSKVWGAAADAQKSYNKAISPLFDIQKEFLGKFASKELGERVADPTKINTYLNQAEKGKAGLKTNYVNNYLNQTQKAADAINNAYLENGLEQPLEEKLNPTPILNHSLNLDPSAGTNLARWTKRGGAAAMGANAAGHVAAEIVGGGLGFLVGHPLAGAWMGDKILKPIFSALAKPFAESAINAVAAKGAVEYAGSAIKGQKALSEAIGNFFKSGAEIIPKHLMPDAASREDAKKSLEFASNPSNLMNAGGSLGHYLPQHATAAAATASRAQNYFASIKPKQPSVAPFDSEMPIDKAQQANYNRQLDIAQQPLLVVQHAKHGTLMPQDMRTLTVLYPELKDHMASMLGQEMINAKTEGKIIPYKTKLGLSQLVGYPVDSTMTPEAMMAIKASQYGAQSQVQQAGQPKHQKASGTAMTQIRKTNDLYKTSLQNSEIDKRES